MTTKLCRSPRRIPTLVAFVACIFIACSTTQLGATVIFPNLPAGSQYQLIFVTLDSTPATSSDISTYNDFVSSEASLSPSLDALGVNWRAIASTTTTNAIVNAPNNGIAVYNTQGQLVATAAHGIYNNGGLSNAPQFNQFGNLQVTGVWTGSNALGARVANGQMGNDNNVETGLSSSTDATWIEQANVIQSVNSFPLYALSSPITVVPEPSSLALIGIGSVGLIARLWRSRRSRRVPATST